MSFEPGDHVVDFVDDALHGLLTAYDEHYVLTHAAECPICSVAMHEAKVRLAAMQSLPTPEAAPALITGLMTRVTSAARAQARRQSFIRRWTVRAVAAAIMIVAGLHIYLATYKPSPYDLRLLGQQQLLAGAPGSVRAQLVKNNVPISDATINLALDDPRISRSVQLASYTTDAAGTGSPRFTLPDWPDGEYTLRADASTGFHTESLSRSITLKHDARLLLSTDKPIYQPGQTLHARALALRRPDLKPVASKEALFTLTDPKGNVIFKQAGVTSSFGIASADCPTATEILQGSYTLLCRVGSTESSTTVEIKNYALPKFKIALSTDKPFYAPGDRVRAVVQANYFFNQHVAGASINLTVSADLAGPQKLASLDALTDSGGHATLEFVLPTSLNGTEQNGGDARIVLTATVRDSASQELTRSLNLVVTNFPIHIELIPESGQLVRGLSNRIYVLTTYSDGRPAKARVTVAGLDQPLATSDLGTAIFELTPQSDQLALTVNAVDDTGLRSSRRVELSVGTNDDYLVRTDKSMYHVGDILALDIIGSDNEPVFVDLLKDGQTMHTSTVPVSKGRGRLTLDLDAELTGTLELNAYRFGETGLATRKTRILYVQPAGDLQIHATLDHPEYRPGDTAHLSLHLTDASGNAVPGALSLAAVDEAVFSVLDQRPGLEKTFFTLDQQLLQPTCAVYPAGPDFFATDPDHALLTQALFSRAANTTIGRDAILARLVRQGSISPRMLQSLNTDWGRRMFREQIEQSGLPEAQQAVMLNEGVFSLDASTGPENVRQAERIQAERRDWLPLLWGVVIIASILALLYVFVRSYLFAFVVLLVMTGCLISIMLPSLGKARELSNPSVAAANVRGIAQALEVDKSMASAGPASDTSIPRLRQFFPETLLWRPELITDDHGDASLDIPLADSITSWRLSSSAVTATGQLGSAQTPIRVFQPFFIDLNLPNTLTTNDEISLPATVYSYLPTPQDVSLLLKRAAWFEILDSESHSLTLAPGDVKSLYFRIRVTKAGTHQLQITAQGSGNVSDALQREITVLPEGHIIETSASGTLARDAIDIPLTFPATVVDGSLHAIVKIYPSTFSQLVEGLDSIFQMPYGCFEQTSSTTYPNVLALSYLRQTSTASPKIEATARQYIQLGYQRLVSFEISGGGFDWFGHPPADRTLSAYGLMEFQDMAAVHNIDPNLISRTRKWLLDQRQSDGSWDPGHSFYHDDPTALGDAKLCTTAYIAWSVFTNNANAGNSAATLSYLRAHASAAKTNPYASALVANALMAIDPQDSTARDLLSTLENNRQSSPDQKQAHWAPGLDRRTAFYGAGNSAGIETTALTTLAMLKAGGHAPTAQAALSWLVANKDAQGTWQSTQATVLALKALLAATSTTAGNNEERHLALELNGKIIHEFRIPADQADVLTSLDLTPFLSSDASNSNMSDQPRPAQLLRLIPRNGPDVVYQVVTHYNLPGVPPSAPQSILDIHIDCDRTQLSVGDQIHATAWLRNASTDALPMVMVDLPIPPGFSADTSSLDTLQSGGTIQKYQITSRQIIVYLDSLNSMATLSIPYSLHALMPVKVAAPAASVYEYYKPEDRASGESTMLEIDAD